MKKTKVISESTIIKEKDYYDRELKIIRKIPSKDELRLYLKNMITFDNLGNDSYGEKKGCSIYKTYNFICKNYFPQYYKEGPANILNNYDFFLFDKVQELFDTLSDENIEFILKETNTYPNHIYGLKNNDGTKSYFDCTYTEIIRTNNNPFNIVLFECFKSELVDLVGKDGPLNTISREVIFINPYQFLVRYLDISGYLIFDFDDEKSKLVLHPDSDDRIINHFSDLFK